MFFPSVIKADKAIDLPSNFFTDRIIFINGEIDDEAAAIVVCELLQLEASDPHSDITMYINSPGGSVSAGLAIYDTMQYISCDVSTVCVGMAASMGAFLLAAGAKGKRYALPHSQIMIHQPLGGVRGQATEIQIVANHILDIRTLVNDILAECTGKPVEIIALDTERDNYLFAPQALEYGLIDGIKERRNDQ
ncbi:MAG TPA: ATP-dependent Clp protease proteolytic subunit [Candidatus Aveggerthella stercoripullorum]|uniref:ATP-dependent Clp protease proteolytic subunit n=1 Tax=Candidatus Aveggerthella stercoripullorum TaxID=2840688 RepID=A0A9D1D3V1_9ACTN|nr:ATP-dependent Clp protease proteolytic subunit [Candidatus Aveggerthella stercoripullorum]